MSHSLSRRHFTLALTALGASALTPLARAASGDSSGIETTDVTKPRILCYVGGYTKDAPPGVEGNGDGIVVFDMDRTTGVLTQIFTFMDIASPSFITFSPDHRYLYAISEIDNYNKEGDGCVTAFAVNQHTGTLTKINTVSSGGAIPAHVSVHPSGKFVFVANYMGGSVAVFPVKPNGGLAEASDIVHLTGPRQPERAADNPQGNFAVSDHSGSHPHMIASNPNGRFVLADDAGLDRIYVWRMDMKNGTLIPDTVPYYNLTPGCAPRHFVFNQAGTILYNLCEQDSKVLVSDFNPTTGAITLIQSVSTVPPYFRGSTLAAEILIDDTGKYVYVSNRLGDSLAIFAVGQDGTLTLQDEVWMHADYGRAMMFDPTGTFLFCANQRSDAVTSFRVNKVTGDVKFTRQYTPVGSPTTFAFLVTTPALTTPALGGSNL
ncbi:lactonase family protein [Oecophyllibacter saccharovorans]|uniref:Lactonase family protein n=1 Tax=Oecophyllibacter saccharovorans TaxID=2558360 RepID=A0A506UR39_9PROT|nr:lactonase family protein [Oecophyllibacter saccharovorans]QDH14600.1 lactonase family protein [Oecophyllibacter saccharovorans]TPW34801.1 lactonase family protein [Oecophyllibacter saccharovorans]TPW35739.1 lactonase family protein [Oecophyllibacter saccharovorans]